MGEQNMTDSTIGFIGLGLIGGSIARAIKRRQPQVRIMAYMRTRARLEQAKADGIVDVILEGIGDQLSQCDLIFLCTPVEYNAQYLTAIRPYLKEGALITDVGSTKTSIHEEIARQGLEDRFVGGHPMAGSEKTGYENSSDHLLENAYYIVTPPVGADGSLPFEEQPENVRRILTVARIIGAIPMVLDYRVHDRVVAAISHLPHLIASSLVNLVRDSDTPAGTMKRVAAGGFKDITRIASLNQVLDQIRGRDNEGIYKLFETSRDYRNSITERARGPLEPAYEFSVDEVDEVGSISTISVILAAKGISIKNIGINNNREHGEGALKIAFYDQESMEAAWKHLDKYKYEMFRV